MNVRDLVPWSRAGGERNLPASQDPGGPLFTLHREVNRLFDDVFRGVDWPDSWVGGAWPHLEIEETEAEYRIVAELPGMDEKDVELLVQDDVLILRGEKRAETKDRTRFSERLYGRFERRVALNGADESGARATFRNGLLTVTVPKTARSRERLKRIPINQPDKTH